MQLLPGSHTVEPALVERLEKDQDGSRPRHLLRVDQLLAAAELAGGDEVLHAGDHHRDDRPGLRDAGGLGHHADLHDLRLDLPKAGLQAPLSGAFRDQDPGRAHERIDDVADPQGELLHPPADAGPDDGLRQIRFGLGQRGFGARLLGREERGDLRLGTLFGGGGGSDRRLAALDGDLKLLDIPARDDARVAPCSSCLVSSSSNGLLVGAPGLLDLAFRRQDIGPRDHQRGVDLGDLAAGGLRGRLLLRAVQPEDRQRLA